MNCFSKERLHRFLNQSLPPDDSAKIEVHLASCPTCCEQLDELAVDPLVAQYHAAFARDGDGRSKDFGDSLEHTVQLGDVAEWALFADDDPKLPLNFGTFVLEEVLGSGGCGRVYRAYDSNLRRNVAVKIPHLGGLAVEVRERFVREGAAAANLHHPHIVQVYQSGTHQGICFLVSEFCPGRTLRSVLDEREYQFSMRDAASIVKALAEAAAHAHDNRIVHRDLKPANVMLDSRSSHRDLPFCPKLTDFGTARFLHTNQSLTASGALIGTVPYMAPEQLDSGEVGPGCDVYALGVILYELVAGRRPIDAESTAATIHRILSFDPPPPHEIVTDVPRDLSAIASKCLQKRPEKRYASAREMADDLQRFLSGEPTVARPIGAVERFIRWSRRNPVPLTIMATVCAIFALTFCGVIWHAARVGEINRQLLEANQEAFAMTRLAERNELQARQLGYVSEMRLAGKAWRDGDFKTVRHILMDYQILAGNRDLRGWEWYFLNGITRERVEEIAGVETSLYSIDLSRDGRYFATGGQDGAIRIYQRDNGQVQRSISAEQGEVNCVDFSYDGDLVASAGDNGTIRVWRVSDGSLVRTMAGHQGLAFGVAFVPGDDRLVSCGSDGSVCVWKGGEQEFAHRDHASRVEAIAVSPDGQWLASVGKDRRLVVRSVTSGELRMKWELGSGTISSVAFAPDSRHVVIGEAGGETRWARILDAENGRETWKRRHPDGILAVAFSLDGTHVVTGDHAGIVRVWNWATKANDEQKLDEPDSLWHSHESRVYSVRFEPDGNSLLSVGMNGSVKRLSVGQSVYQEVMNLDWLSSVTRLRPSESAFHTVRFVDDDRTLVAAAHTGLVFASADGSSKSFRAGKATRSWEQLVATRNGTTLFVGGSSPIEPTMEDLHRPAIVQRWDRSDNSRSTLFQTTDNGSINSLACSPDGKLLVAVLSAHEPEDSGKRLVVMDSLTGKPLWEMPAAIGTKACFSPDGKKLIYGVQRDLHLLDLQTGEEHIVRDTHADSQVTMAVSRDGSWLATSDESREIRLWGLPELSLQAVLKGHQGIISRLQFSPDNRTLLSSSYDGTIKAWHVASGQFLLDLHRGPRTISFMELASDGSQLAFVEDRERVAVYRFTSAL